MPSERTASILQGLGNHDRFWFQTAVYQTPDNAAHHVPLPQMRLCTRSETEVRVPRLRLRQLQLRGERPHPGDSPADGYCSQFCSRKPEIRCQPGEVGGGVLMGPLPDVQVPSCPSS